MDRQFLGVWIPAEIWLDKNLSMVEKGLLAEIQSLDTENHCTAGNEYLAEFCGVSVPTITRAIQKLVELKYIEVVSFDGRHRVIKMIKQPNQNDEAASSKRLASNISNNIDNKDNSIITINSNNIGQQDVDSPKDDVLVKDVLEDPHEYTPEELREDFLGSSGARRKKPIKKRKSLYDQCYDEINKYTDNILLQNVLVSYLPVRLANKDKPLYGVNQWIGMLNKLSELADSVQDRVVIVKQSIERGWCSFFEVKKDLFPKYKKGGGGEHGEVVCIKADEGEAIVTDAKF